MDFNQIMLIQIFYFLTGTKEVECRSGALWQRYTYGNTVRTRVLSVSCFIFCLLLSHLAQICHLVFKSAGLYILGSVCILKINLKLIQ